MPAKRTRNVYSRHSTALLGRMDILRNMMGPAAEDRMWDELPQGNLNAGQVVQAMVEWMDANGYLVPHSVPVQNPERETWVLAAPPSTAQATPRSNVRPVASALQQPLRHLPLLPNPPQDMSPPMRDVAEGPRPSRKSEQRRAGRKKKQAQKKRVGRKKSQAH